MRPWRPSAIYDDSLIAGTARYRLTGCCAAVRELRPIEDIVSHGRKFVERASLVGDHRADVLVYSWVGIDELQ